MKDKKLITIVIILIILAGIIWLSYMLTNNEDKVLDAAERARGPGARRNTSDLPKRYERWDGRGR